LAERCQILKERGGLGTPESMSELFDSVFNQILENKSLREQGKDICIPFPFPRFSAEIPGIQKGRYYIVTANSKVGKTQICDFLFMYGPYSFTKNNNTNIKIRIIYFTLEMSKEDKVKQAISHFLFILKGIRIHPDKMDSIFKNYILEDPLVQAIEEIKPYVSDFLSRVTFIDHTRNPYGIYKAVREYAHAHGHYIDKEGTTLNTEWIESGFNEEGKKIFQYVPNDPDEFVIVITDHVSLLTPEKEGTLHEAIGKLSSNYSLHIRDRWKYIVVNVQQQAAAQEGVENAAANMIRPSANGLGDNKLTGRDCDMMLGLFAPIRFRRAEWEGYDIKRLRDAYRELSVILNRRGSAVLTDVYFDGCVNYFAELPTSNKMTPEMYKAVEERRVRP